MAKTLHELAIERGFGSSAPTRSEILAIVKNAADIDLATDPDAFNVLLSEIRRYMGTQVSQLRNVRRTLRDDRFISHLALDVVIVHKGLTDRFALSKWMNKTTDSPSANGLPNPTADESFA
jgi:hypothetical protein